jgi:site-specific DNA recombinase
MQAEVEFNSCEAQESKIRSYIASQDDMEVVEHFSDVGFTGANTERPALARMMANIRSGRLDVVVVYKIDRLTRSPRDFYQLIELFEEHHVSFISVTERFDTSTPAGRLLRNIMLTFAQFERELTSERTRDKMMERAQKGMWNGGMTPFGYTSVNKQLMPHPEHADTVRAIFRDYMNARPLADIKRQFGISGGHIATILRNPIYAGKIRYAGKTTKGSHEALISCEDFELVQTLHKNAKRWKKPFSDHVFAGLVICDECGSHMTPTYTNKRKNGRTVRYRYYRCTSTYKKDWACCSTKMVSAERFDEVVLSDVERMAMDRQYVENLVFRLNAPVPQERSLDGLRNGGVSGVSGVHQGLEPSGRRVQISPEDVTQALSELARSCARPRGVARSEEVKKRVRGIRYSKEAIRVQMVVGGVGEFVGDALKKGAEKRQEEKLVCSVKMATGSSESHTIELILPNRIHACRRKDL